MDIDYHDFNKKMDEDLLVKKPRKITFVSSKNAIMNASVSITINDGDITGIIGKVAQDGGLFGKNTETNEYFFIPWPCAIITITN